MEQIDHGSAVAETMAAPAVGEGGYFDAVDVRIAGIERSLDSVAAVGAGLDERGFRERGEEVRRWEGYYRSFLSCASTLAAKFPVL